VVQVYSFVCHYKLKSVIYWAVEPNTQNKREERNLEIYKKKRAFKECQRYEESKREGEREKERIGVNVRESVYYYPRTRYN
jgi:hypothetical protein